MGAVTEPYGPWCLAVYVPSVGVRELGFVAARARVKQEDRLSRANLLSTNISVAPRDASHELGGHVETDRLHERVEHTCRVAKDFASRGSPLTKNLSPSSSQSTLTVACSAMAPVSEV